MCAGVQNVSRPTASCQEMSQALPTTAENTDTMQHHMYQGIDADSAYARSTLRAWIGGCSEIVPAICVIPPPSFYTRNSTTASSPHLPPPICSLAYPEHRDGNPVRKIRRPQLQQARPTPPSATDLSSRAKRGICSCLSNKKRPKERAVKRFNLQTFTSEGFSFRRSDQVPTKPSPARKPNIPSTDP